MSLAVSGYCYNICNTSLRSAESSPIAKDLPQSQMSQNSVENKGRCSVLLLQISNLRCMCKSPEALSVVSGGREAALGPDASAPALHCTVAQPGSFHWLPAELGTRFRNLKLNT